MRAYKIVAVDGDTTLATRLAGTQADAKTTRDELMEQFDVKKNSVTIEEEEVPMDKPSLLAYINAILEGQDAVEEEGGEDE